MKIVLDARILGSEGAGVGKYVDKLLTNLADLDRENDYVVILRAANYHFFNPGSGNFRKVLLDAHWYSFKEQLLLPPLLIKEKPDLVHFPHFNVPLFWRGKFVVTIHDLTLTKYGREISKSRLYPAYLAKKAAYEATLRRAVASSKKIITPSNFVKKELAKVLKVPKEKIVVTHEATSDIFLEYREREISEGEKRKVLATYGIRQPFILTVGNSYPYKNFEGVLTALEILPKNLSVVHVSKKDYFGVRLLDKAKDLGLENRFTLTGLILDENLITLYKLAEAFVFPSLSEGFGLPGLEAMAVGTPVVCSDIEVFKEVYGDAAAYFDPKNAKDLASKIEFIMKNAEFRINLTKKGLEQVKKYSWKKMAEETLKVYESV